MIIDWLKYVKQVKVSTERPIKKKNPKTIITLSSWERRSYDNESSDHDIIDYSTNFSSN